MPRTQHLVTLSAAERAQLQQLARKGTAPVREVLHAQILLAADRGRGGKRLTDAEIAAVVSCSPRTVARVRSHYCTSGLDRALERKDPDRVYRRRLDGDQEARVLALACSHPPGTAETWTLRLLRDRVVELGIVPALGITTLWELLKKTPSSPGRSGPGNCPPRPIPASSPPLSTS